MINCNQNFRRLYFGVTEAEYANPGRFATDMYFAQDTQPFMPNAPLFNPMTASSAGDYQRSFVKTESEPFLPANPFTHPTYPHFAFPMQSVQNPGQRMRAPLQCKWIEVYFLDQQKNKKAKQIIQKT